LSLSILYLLSQNGASLYSRHDVFAYIMIQLSLIFNLKNLFKISSAMNIFE